MPISNRQSSRLQWPKIGSTICICALTLCHFSCNSKEATSISSGGTAKETNRHLGSDLALARVDLAKHAVARLAPEQALPLLVAAIEADPSCSEAISMADNILQQTRWFLPDTALKHGQMSIDSLHLDSAATLWSAVSFDDESDLNSSANVHTVVKWNLDTLRIENVLFPVKANETSCMLFDPTHRYAVIKRSLTSSEDTVLLCDAQSLKPILDLGPLPKFLSPSAVIVFSADGLLVAHPTLTSGPKRALIWNLRDTRTGEIIRTSEPCPLDQPLPLTASLNRSRLRVLHSDATLLEIPVSPANPEIRKPIIHPAHLLQAQFRENDAFAEALVEYDGPHRRPILITLTIDEKTPLDPTDTVASLERFPWTAEPNIWNGLLREEKFPAIRVDSTHVTFHHFPSYDVNSSITAVALRGDRIAFGDINGGLNLFKILPLPSARRSANPFSPNTLKPNDISAVAHLTDTLTGNRYDPVSRSMIQSDPKQRIEAFAKCDFEALVRVFPSLDFSPLIETIKKSPPRSIPPDATDLFTQRIARATDHSPHPELIAAFDKADADTVKSAILSAGPSGPTAAKALELALASSHPEWIEACVSHAKDLPPLLRNIALSRIAWLQDRKADAISSWPEVFPNLTQVRLREDWDGWESADFSQALENIRLCVKQELDTLIVPEPSTLKQRQAVITRLSDPLTLKTIGRARFANACLKAALALATFKEHGEATLKLAATARNLGESPAPCLRAEALSFTALGDYQKARDRWVTLITEHPLQDQVPGDYTEAAYTSFENADPQQAMAILTTGHHRFPNDANFALRAGWIALLTNNSEQAYRFLLSGRQIGYPPEKLENALALLALSAAQSGATDDAAVFYQDLIKLAPAWKQPETIDTLEWPDEMKDTLKQLVP